MWKIVQTLLICCLLFYSFAASGCSSTAAGHSSRSGNYDSRGRSVEKAKSQGPPPHAPAHGYRHRQHLDEIEMVFDERRGIYIVVGFPGCYYFDGQYFSRYEGRWQVSDSPRHGWRAVDIERVPAGLR